MPTVSRFFGIEIAIFFRDHPPPHFHASYAEFEAQVRIEDGEIMAGWLPPRASALVRMWWRRYKLDIVRSWERVQMTGLVERVPPLE